MWQSKLSGTCAAERTVDMSTYTEGQVHQLANAFEEAEYTPANLTALGQDKGLLAQIKLVLVGLATIVRGALKLACTKVFNPQGFIDKGWSVWKGSADGNGLKGEKDRDAREDGLTVIDWEQAIFETNLEKGESLVSGEEKLKRLKAGKNIRLGGKAFLSLWEDYQANKDSSVLERLRKAKNITLIYFFGTVLRGQDGGRLVLYLSFDRGQWDWRYYGLVHDWSGVRPSASLASV